MVQFYCNGKLRAIQILRFDIFWPILDPTSPCVIWWHRPLECSIIWMDPYFGRQVFNRYLIMHNFHGLVIVVMTKNCGQLMFGKFQTRLPGLHHGLVGLANFFTKRMLFSNEFVSRIAVALDPTFQALDEIADCLTFLVYLQKKEKLKYSSCVVCRISIMSG